jgi:hypothetical protein
MYLDVINSSEKFLLKNYYIVTLTSEYLHWILSS